MYTDARQTWEQDVGFELQPSGTVVQPWELLPAKAANPWGLHHSTLCQREHRASGKPRRAALLPSPQDTPTPRAASLPQLNPSPEGLLRIFIYRYISLSPDSKYRYMYIYTLFYTMYIVQNI